VDDRFLLSELVGPSAAFVVRDMPVAELLEASPDRLAQLGVRPAARRRLLAGAELARRFQPAVTPSRAVQTARDLLPHLTVLRGAATEALGVLSLDAHCGLLSGLVLVATGGLTRLQVAAREVYAPALERRAAAIVIAHNHPSGDVAPSPEDLVFTRLMAQAGQILGVGLLDHVIVARRTYLSLREAGLWDAAQ
jgi:DNA repair protein RadC